MNSKVVWESRDLDIYGFLEGIEGIYVRQK